MPIKACLNRDRKAEEHPALPLFPGKLARDARFVVAAGAGALHLHPRRSDGSETLEAGDVGAVMEAVHAACPNIPVGVSTGAWIGDLVLQARINEPRERRSVTSTDGLGALVSASNVSIDTRPCQHEEQHSTCSDPKEQLPVAPTRWHA